MRRMPPHICGWHEGTTVPRGAHTGLVGGEMARGKKDVCWFAAVCLNDVFMNKD